MDAMSSASPFLESVSEAALAESRAFNAGLERLLAAQPSIHTIPVEVTRRVRREGKGIFPPPVYLPEARDVTIPTRAGSTTLRVVAPPGTPKGIYLHVHGGGWMLGAADMQDPALAALAKATGLLVASVDYRLTPEHPHPAGADDCEETEVRFLSSQSAFDAARWLVEKGAKELGAPAWLAIGGESAGAHLSVLALLRLRDRHGIKGAFRAANLVFGGFDLTKTPSVRRWGDRYLVLSGPVLDFFSDALVPGVPVEVRHDPEISPLYAELSGLPPALFTVGTLDPLLDDTLFMHARWRAAGNDATLKVWPESIHGFTAFPLQIAKAANEAQEAFLRTTLT